MKIVVTGSLGNISKPLTKILTANTHQVVVISSSTDRREDIEKTGATAAIGSIDDVAFLNASFQGADAVYLMIPPNFKEFNSLAYYKRIAENYRKAIQNSGVEQIVFLSSWGAHLDRGTGTILGSHHAELILNELDAVHKTYIRPVSIYYNLLNYIEMIKNTGIIGSNFKRDDKIAWVHPEDIAQAVSEELMQSTDEIIKIRYVASDEKTAAETTHILGQAIDRPDLDWVPFSDADVEKSFKERGLPETFAQDLVAINASISSGRMGEDYEKNKPKLGNIKLEQYAKEFAKAYHNH
ncbi:NAD-dependent dehydratase [Marivirga lumbricoides]|uniref:NAD-dependent dehydratase n=1 Tax=Marivirga lumbricoides TaxID=1046115 RepID=A0A2T4DT14_9BACT|nr:NAD-dependent dehydratase [Marivirga lumbricoides]